MMHGLRGALGVLVVAVTTFAPGQVEARQAQLAQAQASERPVIRRPIFRGVRPGALPFVRTELFFGTAKPDGVVTELDFQLFVDREVTPRFPDGLTVVKADGQFRGANDEIVKEQSFVLILLYPLADFTDGSRRIDAIRTLYKDEFDQESVLRVDDPFTVWVSF